MLPASWAEYTMMVAEITHHTRDHIMHRMSYTEGLHFVALWWQRQSSRVQLAGGKGFDVIRPVANPGHLDTVL